METQNTRTFRTENQTAKLFYEGIRSDIMAPIYGESLIFEKIGLKGYPFSHCSNLTQLDENTLMAQWYSGKAEQASNQSIFGAKYNINTGKWSEPFLLSKHTEYPEGNGVIWKDKKTGKLFLFFATIWTRSFFKKMFGRGWFYCKLFYKISNDNGKTWGPVITFRDETGYMFRNKPIRLRSGRILLPMYREVPPNGVIAISDDDGQTFYYSDFIEDHPRYPRKIDFFGGYGNTQPTLTELENGSVLALMRTRGRRRIFRSVSEDGGKSWSPAEEINLPNPDSGIDMVRTSGGKLILIFNNAERGRHDLSVAVAEDSDGKKWKVIKTLENNPRMRFSYPAVITTDDGLIHITYTYNRKTIKHVYFNEEWLFG